MNSPDRIVVGYDGSTQAALAVRWAARYATLMHCELEVVHCSLWPLLTSNLGPVRGIPGSGLQQQSQAVIADGQAEALSAEPGAKVRGTLLYGLPAGHLRRVAEDARLLVLGSRGMGGFIGLLVGSVSLELAATASCPVAVIRFDQNKAGRIVVGIDSSGSAAALGIACFLASATEAELLLIHVVRPRSGPAGSAEDSPGEGRRLLTAAVVNARAQAPDVTVRQHLAQDSSIPRALLNAARGAALIVVGSKAHGVLRGVIGSNAHAVLHHATVPVLISRTREQTRASAPNPR